jgi:TRAP-type C4-dicarboxylate transport system permease small subunit
VIEQRYFLRAAYVGLWPEQLSQNVSPSDRRGDHAFVCTIVALLPQKAERACLAFADVMVVFVAGVTGIALTELLASNWSERAPILRLPGA